MTTREGMPILISSTAVVAPNQHVGISDTTGLRNPFGDFGTWIDEIRFFTNDSSGFSGGELYIRVSLGRQLLTRDYVPISMLGKVLNPYLEGEGQSILFVYRWVLPKRMLIPKGERLFVEFFNSNASGINKTYSVRVSAAGQSTHEEPEKLHIPWVSYWLAPTFTSGLSVPGTVQSLDKDICNPWDQEMIVDCFVGRVFDFEASGGEIYNSTIVNTGIASYGFEFLQVRIRDSLGTIVVRDPTPFDHLFNRLDRTWQVKAKLPPKGYYIVYLDEVVNPNTSFSPATPNIQPMISIMGHRDIARESL